MKYLLFLLNERGPLDAWLTEAVARQNADIAARNILAKTTAALQQKKIDKNINFYIFYGLC